jgi:hypothetical protein
VMALDELDRLDEAQLAFEDMVENADVPHEWQAKIYTRRGENDKAFEVLQSLSVEDDEFGWRSLEDPEYVDLHSDPRWQTLVDKIGLSSVKPTHIELNVPTPVEWQ